MRRLSRAAAVAFVVVSAGCTTPGPLPDPVDPNQMNESVRSSAIEAANAKYLSMLGDDPAAARQQMVDYLKGQPEFRDAGLVGTEVYGQFNDGVVMLFINNRIYEGEIEGAQGIFFDPGDLPGPGPDPGPAPPRDVTVSRRQLGIPYHPVAFIASSMGPDYIGSDVSPLVGLMAAHGYQRVGHGRATLNDLRNGVKNVGVLYLNTHGGVGRCPAEPGQEDGEPIFCVWTDTEETEELRNDLWESDLKPCKLVLASAPFFRKSQPNNGHFRTHFAFTHKFVSEHMSFCPDSLVYIDACWSQSPHATALRDAFIAKGASVYGGWTETVIDLTAGPATAFLFDRMLGANNPGIYPEDPDQRAFDWLSDLNDMRQRSPRLDTANNADGTKPFLTFSWATPDNNTDFGLLAPSIRHMWVDELKDELHLVGRFGYKQGTVVLGGSDLAVTSWEYSDAWQLIEIVCELPRDEHGDVTVFVDARPSNTVQLSMWELRMVSRVSLIDPDATGQIDLEIEVTLKMRACLNDFRQRPHEEPMYVLQSIPMNVSRSSTGMVTAMGEQFDQNIETGNFTRVTAMTPEDQNWVVVDQLGDAGEDDYQIESLNYVQLGDNGPGLTMHFEVAGYWEYQLETEDGTDCCARVPTGFASNTYFDTSEPIQMELDESFNIIGGMMDDRIDGSSTLQWFDAAVQSPPQPAAQR